MGDDQSSDFCLGFPIDHRLKPLFVTGLASQRPPVGHGGHAQAIESYGRRLQTDGRDISDNEVNFAKWLAMPETKGGVVIVLQQPAEHQRYFSDHHGTAKDCDTLDAVDEVCKAVTGCGLEKISCFDAFPFHKIPVRKSLDRYEKTLDEAYDVFLHMIQQKQPDVVFCCYNSPHSTKYGDFQCIRIGRTHDGQVTVQGQRYTCVNGFHPSYALNHLEDKSELRSLFITEATQAFRRANDTWREPPWVMGLRETCADIVKRGMQDQKREPSWTKHDFQRDRFQSYMESITRMLDSLKSGAYDDMTNDGLYDLVLKERLNFVFANCLLLLVKIVNFEDHGGPRLQDKGFVELRQREERDVRDLRRNVEKICDEFMRSIHSSGAPFQVEKGGKGMLIPAGLTDSLLPLRSSKHQSGFHADLRLSFRNFVIALNGAYMYRVGDVYEADRDALARAFRVASVNLELALTKHVASTQRQIQEDLPILSQFNLLSMDSSPQQTKYAAHPGTLQTRTAPTPISASPRSPLSTPPRAPAVATTPPLSSATTWSSSPPTAPRFGGVSPFRSPQAASPPKYRSAPTCKVCKEAGHTSRTCPKTQCYRCKGFGHMTFACPVNPSTPQRRR